jgi:hypothetical protein
LGREHSKAGDPHYGMVSVQRTMICCNSAFAQNPGKTLKFPTFLTIFGSFYQHLRPYRHAKPR